MSNSLYKMWMLPACIVLFTATLGASQNNDEVYVLVAESYQQGVEITKLYRGGEDLSSRWQQMNGRFSRSGDIAYFKAYTSARGAFTKKITVCDYFGSSLITDAEDCASIDRSATVAYSFFASDVQTDETRNVTFENCFDPYKNISYSVVHAHAYCAEGYHRVVKSGYFYAYVGKMLCDSPAVGDKAIIRNRVYEDVVRLQSVTFGCVEGYTTHGPDTFTCSMYGAWRPHRSSRTPICQAVSCGSPTIEHGRPTGRQFTFGESTSYVCDEGYNLFPSDASIQCQASGEWSGTAGECKPISCGRPSPVPHGHAHGSVFTYGQRLRYVCDEGYRNMISRAGIVCNKQGKWYGLRANCRRIICYSPGVPRNGMIIGDDFAYGSTVQFACDDGFTLVGHNSVTCGRRGWIGFKPTCQASG